MMIYGAVTMFFVAWFGRGGGRMSGVWRRVELYDGWVDGWGGGVSMVCMICLGQPYEIWIRVRIGCVSVVRSCWGWMGCL